MSIYTAIEQGTLADLYTSEELRYAPTMPPPRDAIDGKLVGHEEALVEALAKLDGHILLRPSDEGTQLRLDILEGLARIRGLLSQRR